MGAKFCLSNQKNFLVPNWSPCFHWDQWSLCLQDQQVNPARGCRLQSVAVKLAISRMCWPTKHSPCTGCLLGTPGSSHFAELLEILHMENIPPQSSRTPMLCLALQYSCSFRLVWNGFNGLDLKKKVELRQHESNSCPKIHHIGSKCHPTWAINSTGVQLSQQPECWNQYEKGTDGLYWWNSQIFAKSREKVRCSCPKMEMRCNRRVCTVDWNTQDADRFLGRHCTHKQHIFKKDGRQPHFNRLSPCPFFNLTSKKRSAQFLSLKLCTWKYLSHLDLKKKKVNVDYKKELDVILHQEWSLFVTRFCQQFHYEDFLHIWHLKTTVGKGIEKGNEEKAAIKIIHCLVPAREWVCL